MFTLSTCCLFGGIGPGCPKVHDLQRHDGIELQLRSTDSPCATSCRLSKIVCWLAWATLALAPFKNCRKPQRGRQKPSKRHAAIVGVVAAARLRLCLGRASFYTVLYLTIYYNPLRSPGYFAAVSRLLQGRGLCPWIPRPAPASCTWLTWVRGKGFESKDPCLRTDGQGRSKRTWSDGDPRASSCPTLPSPKRLASCLYDVRASKASDPCPTCQLLHH